MELKDKVLRKVIIFVMVAAIAIPFISPEIFAASKITAEGGEKVKAGDTFTVRVTYGGDEQIGRVDGKLIYDISKLEYISGGTSEGDTGYVQLKLAGTDGTIMFTLKFKALEAGDTDLEITTNEMYDFAEIPLDTPSLTKTVSINDGGAVKVDPDKQIETAPTDQLESDDTELIIDDSSEGENENNITMILLISAAVLLVLIIIIAVVLRKRR